MIRRALVRLDDAVHWCESRLIAAALAVMSVTVFLDVLHRRLSDPRSKMGDWMALLVGAEVDSSMFVTLQDKVAPTLSLLILLGLTRWVSGTWPRAVGLTLALYAFGALMEHASSAVVYAVVSGVLYAAFLWYVAGWPDGVKRLKATLGATLALALVGAGLSSMPQGYSWAQTFSLFLLLWVGFLGASVATRGRSHIQVDAFRKYVPDHLLAWYNAVSLAVAGAFSCFLLMIAYLYTFGPDGNIHHAADIGRVPDWLVTASLPVAFGIITVRFGAQVVQEVEAALSGSPSPMGRHDGGTH